MDTKNVLNIFNTMVNENIVYIFHGEFNYTMVDTLLTDVKRELTQSGAARGTSIRTRARSRCAFRQERRQRPAQRREAGSIRRKRQAQGDGIDVVQGLCHAGRTPQGFGILPSTGLSLARFFGSIMISTKP